MFRVACNCEISNGGSHKATLIVQSSGQSRHPEIIGRSQMRINVADSFHRIENLPVCDAIKLSMEPGSEAGPVRQLLSPDDPSTRDTVVKAGKPERCPKFRGILGYFRVNKTRLIPVGSISFKKILIFSHEGQFRGSFPGRSLGRRNLKAFFLK